MQSIPDRIKEIQRVAAKYHGHTRAELLGEQRGKSLQLAREAAMLAARRLPGTPSYPRLGDLFLRDHSCVLRSVRVAERLEAAEPWFGLLVARLELLGAE